MRYVGTTAILQLHPKALAWKYTSPDYLSLTQAKVARHVSDDTIGLVDLCTRQDAFACILGVQHVRCGVYGLQGRSLHTF